MLHTPLQTLDNEIVTTTRRPRRLQWCAADEIPFVNGLLKKKGQQQLVQYCYLRHGIELTVRMLDGLKDLGFLYATKSGLSIGIDDLVIPREKPSLVNEARRGVIVVEEQYLQGAITDRERKNKVIDIWSGVTEKIADEMFVGWRRSAANCRDRSSTRSSSWRIPARAAASSRSASSPGCAA